MSQGKLQRFAQGLASSLTARALLLSVLLHLAVIGALELGRSLGFWESSALRKLLRNNIPELVEQMTEQRRAQEQQPAEVPLVFVEVDPSQAAEEAPDTPFYSTQNTTASNPDPAVDTATPRFEGTQELVPRTMDVVRAEPVPPPPPPPAPAPEREVMRPAPQPEPEPEPEGETRMARAVPRPTPPPPQPRPPAEQPPIERTRPRTLAEARGLIEGSQMRQEGGVPRASLSSNLDVRATPFGNYDALFIAAVQARWFSLLDERDYIRGEAGRVVLDFRLHADGRITEMRVADRQVSEMLAWLCQRAVLDPAPYAPFPAQLRREMGKDFREVRFTFYYNR